jgi:ketosteroid isomerase-like protein
MDLTKAVREHERRFNEAVRAGDFTEFVTTFAEDAVMAFDDLPIGPYKGREAIARAYAQRPPDDTMTIWSIEEVNKDTADVRFDWDAGGGGSMRVTWRDGLVAATTISFRE